MTIVLRRCERDFGSYMVLASIDSSLDESFELTENLFSAERGICHGKYTEIVQGMLT